MCCCSQLWNHGRFIKEITWATINQITIAKYITLKNIDLLLMITKVLTCEHLPKEDIFNLDMLYFDEMFFCLLYKREIPMDTEILYVMFQRQK